MPFKAEVSENDLSSCFYGSILQHANIKNLHHALLLPSFYAFNNMLLLKLISVIQEEDVADINSYNILYLSPNENGNILIEEVRNMIDFASKSTISKAKKFIIINNISSVAFGAVNAMLKVLEEPPPETFFLLIYYDLSGILPTIKSRCLQIPFKNSFSIFESLCKTQESLREHIEYIGNLVSYNVNLLYLFKQEATIAILRELESLINQNFNYLQFKVFYRKYQNVAFFKEIISLKIEYLFRHHSHNIHKNKILLNEYFSFILQKKSVKLYNGNFEMLFYCTIYILCKNIFGL